MRCITQTTVNNRVGTNVRRITSAVVAMRLVDLRLGLDARGALYAPFAAAALYAEACEAGTRMPTHSKTGTHKSSEGKPSAGQRSMAVAVPVVPQGQPQWQVLSQAQGIS